LEGRSIGVQRRKEVRYSKAEVGFLCEKDVVKGYGAIIGGDIKIFNR